MHTIDFIILYLNWMSEIILKLKKNKMPIALAFSLKNTYCQKKKKSPQGSIERQCSLLVLLGRIEHFFFILFQTISLVHRKKRCHYVWLTFSFPTVKKRLLVKNDNHEKREKKNQSCNRHSSHSKVWVKLGFDGSVKCFLRSLFDTQSCWN